MGIFEFLRRGKENTQIQKWKIEIDSLTIERNGLREDVIRLREDLNAKTSSVNSMDNSLKHAKTIIQEYKAETSILKTRLNTLEEMGITSREGTVKKIMEDDKTIGYNEAKILEILYNAPNVRLNSKDIRKELGIARSTAYVVIENLLDTNKVEKLGSQNKTFIMLRKELTVEGNKDKTQFVGQIKEDENKNEFNKI